MKKLTTNGDERERRMREGGRNVGRKSEWEHCAPDGLVASAHLDPRAAYVHSVPLLFHNNGERRSAA